MKTLALRVVLLVLGGLLCLSGVFLVMPGTQFETMMGWFVGAERAAELWTGGPLLDYLLRVCLAAYLWIGVVLLVAAANPTRHRTQIHVAILAFLLLAGVCTLSGIRNKLPALMWLGDAVPSVLAAVLLFVLRPGKPTA